MNRHTSLRLRIYGRDRQANSAELGRVGEPLRVSLETALVNLERLPRMFVEQDGSFLWTGEATTEASSGFQAGHWQLEGTLYDDGQVVRYVDLRGDCPLAVWKTFLEALDATLESVTLQLVENDLIVPGEWLEQQLASQE